MRASQFATQRIARLSRGQTHRKRAYPSRFFSTIVQLNPACAPSSTRNSKCLRSSWTGTPHSRSWYWSISGSSTLTHEHRLMVAVALCKGSSNDASEIGQHIESRSWSSYRLLYRFRLSYQRQHHENRGNPIPPLPCMS